MGCRWRGRPGRFADTSRPRRCDSSPCRRRHPADRPKRRPAIARSSHRRSTVCGCRTSRARAIQEAVAEAVPRWRCQGEVGSPWRKPQLSGPLCQDSSSRRADFEPGGRVRWLQERGCARRPTGVPRAFMPRCGRTISEEKRGAGFWRRPAIAATHHRCGAGRRGLPANEWPRRLGFACPGMNGSETRQPRAVWTLQPRAVWERGRGRLRLLPRGGWSRRGGSRRTGRFPGDWISSCARIQWRRCRRSRVCGLRRGLRDCR